PPVCAARSPRSYDPAVRFGELLRRHREAAGLTQEALAQLAQLSPRGISDLERGVRRTPYPETVRALARALGLGEGARAALVAAARAGGGHVAELPIEAAPGGSLDRFVGRERDLGTVRRLLSA